jgi:methylated-DNA-[protein]-cysteine S-methyltransferase
MFQLIYDFAEINMYYAYLDSPVGPLTLVADGAAIRQLSFGRLQPQSDWQHNDHHLAEAIRQLQAYFRGDLEIFDLPRSPAGTPFQLAVWRELCRIPYGETISYAGLARRIGNPKACRAVGLANGSNPIAIIMPCHRVIGSNGKLTGYGGGLPIKEKLLALERKQLTLLAG